MVVCVCRCVTEREIARAIREGATSAEAVARRCGAGTGCGACVEAVERILGTAVAAPAAAERAAPLLREEVVVHSPLRQADH